MSTFLPIKGDQDKKIGAYNAPLSVSAQDAPNMTVKIRAGSFYNSANALVEYSGGNSPIISAPITGAKWVLVTITDTGSIALVNGASGSAPSLPAVPPNSMALAAVYVPSTTTAITAALVQDVRPFLRSMNSVPDVAAELADRPTFNDVANDLALKADVDGTTSSTFTLNKEFTVGSPGADALLNVKRGSAPDVAIRWNESIDMWEFTNDGITFTPIASTSGTYAPIVHYHVATDVTDFTPAVTAVINAATIAQSQVTGLSGALAAKANQTDFQSHATDASIHHTLPLPQTAITDLVADLAEKLDVTGGTVTGDITVQGAGNQPITLTSTDSGSSGLKVTRTPADARLEWDESAQAWMAGTVGSMNTILTGNVAVQSVNGQSGVVVLDSADIGAAPAVHTHVAANITDFATAVQALIPVDSVNGQTGAVVLTPGDVGAADAVHTHVSANITDFTAAAAAAAPVQSVNGNTGTVVLSAVDVGAAPTVHTHTASAITDFATAVGALIPPDAVQSVNSQTGTVVLTAGDVGAAPVVHTHTSAQITDFATAVGALIPPDAVTSVNGQTGVVVLNSGDVGAAPTVHTHTSAAITDFGTAAAAAAPVQSVNGNTGTVVLTAGDVGAAPTVHTHTASQVTDFGAAADARIAAASITDLADVNTSSPVSGEVLEFVGTAWVNVMPYRPLEGINTTTDATPIDIVGTDIPLDSVIAFDALVSAIEVSTGDVAMWKLMYTGRNLGGTVTSPVTTIQEFGSTPGATAWTVAPAVVGSAVLVRATGEAGKTILWKTRINYA